VLWQRTHSTLFDFIFAVFEHFQTVLWYSVSQGLPEFTKKYHSIPSAGITFFLVDFAGCLGWLYILFGILSSITGTKLINLLTTAVDILLSMNSSRKDYWETTMCTGRARENCCNECLWVGSCDDCVNVPQRQKHILLSLNIIIIFRYSILFILFLLCYYSPFICNFMAQLGIIVMYVGTDINMSNPFCPVSHLWCSVKQKIMVYNDRMNVYMIYVL
jgi:hypothetical protein